MYFKFTCIEVKNLSKPVAHNYGEFYPSGNTWLCQEAFLITHEMLLAYSGQKREMLINILTRTGQSLSTSLIQPTISIVAFEKLCSRPNLSFYRRLIQCPQREHAQTCLTAGEEWDSSRLPPPHNRLCHIFELLDPNCQIDMVLPQIQGPTNMITNFLLRRY